MRSFIRCLKLLKYGSCVRKQLTFMLVIAVIGMILEFRSINSFIGGFYIFLFPITIGHMFISLSMSGLIQSSVLKKKLQVLYPYVVSFPLMSLSLLVVIAHRVWLIHNGVEGLTDAENRMIQSTSLLEMGIFMFFCFIYFALVYKFYAPSFIFFIAFMIPGMVIVQNDTFGISRLLAIDFRSAVIATIILFISGNLVSLIISNLVYKYSLSEYMIKRSVGKMQW